MFKNYKFGFDIWGLVLFLGMMIPNFIWFSIPAPNDVLRITSTTPIADAIASFCQVSLIACLTCLINTKRSKLGFSPVVIASIACLLIYYIGWILYYSGITPSWVILLLTLPPCLSFIFFAIDRKNLPAILFGVAFAICHLIFAIENFIK